MSDKRDEEPRDRAERDDEPQVAAPRKASERGGDGDIDGEGS